MNETDALFAHLEELVARMDEMQAEGDRLVLARAAREVLDADRRLQGQRNELSGVQARMDAVSDPMLQAALGNQLGVRAGAAKQAERDLSLALISAGFADVDEARAASLPDDELDALQIRVDSYREDYLRTFDACRAAEAAASGSDSHS